MVFIILMNYIIIRDLELVMRFLVDDESWVLFAAESVEYVSIRGEELICMGVYI